VTEIAAREFVVLSVLTGAALALFVQFALGWRRSAPRHSGLACCSPAGISTPVTNAAARPCNSPSLMR